MITRMKKYTFLVFHRDYEAFLSSLREQGVVHINVRQQGLAENADMQKALECVDATRHLISQHATDEQLHQRDVLTTKVSELNHELVRLAPLGDYSADALAGLAQAGYDLHVYTCPAAKYEAEWGTVLSEQGSSVLFATLQPIENEVVSEFALGAKSPAELRAERESLEAKLTALDAEIASWWTANEQKLQAELAEAEKAVDWTKVVLSTDQVADGALCLVEGFAPEDTWSALEENLRKQDVYFEASDPTEEDATPIKLHNNAFTRLFESFTGMYGWPTYGEFDPTPILAPFYLLFFAMCLGDAGYGIILLIFGLLTHYKKVNISMFEGQGPIIAVLGAGTMVVGTILGTFFGISLSEASWYPESLKAIILHGDVMGFDIQMVASLVIGVVHICLAMVIKSICFTKRYGLRENLGTWGWTLLIVGGIIFGSLAMALNLPAMVVKVVVIALAVVSGLGIFIFNKPGRNPLINIGAGLYDTYNVASGLISDVLSYVRLYALGLSGGILGSTFNTLGLMLIGDKDSTSIWLLAIEIAFACVILLFGHVLNILLSSLGAFVHPLRLTFVEYFKNAGYEGKGVKYNPFKK